MKSFGLVILFFIMCAYVSVVWAAHERTAVAEGNRLFKQEQYDQALQKYNEAVASAPDSAIIQFNIGTAQYRKGEFDKAIDAFTNALITDDPVLEAKANYNLANSKYRQGRLKEHTDLGVAVNLFRDSLSYYKRAMELHEDDTDAKFNHEFVETQLKMLLDKMKQQQQQQQQQQQEEQQQQKKQQGAQAQAQAGQEEEQQAAQREEEERSAAEEQAQEKREARPEQREAMSEEEARMLLEGLRQEDVGRIFQQRPRRGRMRSVTKDW